MSFLAKSKPHYSKRGTAFLVEKGTIAGHRQEIRISTTERYLALSSPCLLGQISGHNQAWQIHRKTKSAAEKKFLRRPVFLVTAPGFMVRR
jgi:hypothetical protein